MSSSRLSPCSWRARRSLDRAPLAVSVAFALALTACGGGDELANGADKRRASPTNTVSAVTLNGEWPLTGELLDGGLPNHPVYVVKIDNTSSSAPQMGLSSADLVVEELVEGGLTRLAALYYEDIPKVVGPVRSMRASDIGIVKPISATVVASGAADRTIGRLNGAKISFLSEGSTGYYRDSSRSAPYNLFVELTKLAGNPPKRWGAPQSPYLTFGREDDFQGTMSVRTITAQFSGGHTTRWEYTDGGWLRPDSFAQEKEDFEPDNILLLRVRTQDAGYRDPAGNPVPETILVGKGDAVLVHGDHALRCTWSKAVKGSQLHLRMRDGDEVTVPAGNTWIELVPSDGGGVTLSR